MPIWSGRMGDGLPHLVDHEDYGKVIDKINLESQLGGITIDKRESAI
jgi:hypothetical protein